MSDIINVISIISLEEASKRLSLNTEVLREALAKHGFSNVLPDGLPEQLEFHSLIALEPGEQWVFDPATGQTRRVDGRFFDVRPINRGSFWQVGIFEEPNLQNPPAGQSRIIGNVKISRNPRGRIKSRMSTDLDGEEFMEATLSSLSNPEVVAFEEAAVTSGLIKANPQRIGGGYIRVFLVEEEFDDSEGVTADELARTHDGRTLSAMRKLGI